jgi:predicted TPR repeat methyltransferase
MTLDYRKSHLQREKGTTYHATFSNEPYRKMVWQFEKDIIDRILASLYSGIQIYHLDFACGTGRILAHVEGRAKHAVGVDVSPSMLKVARDINRPAEIIEADLTIDDVLGERKFNLITAFRFFPNAQPELRKQVMQLLSIHLEDNGYLVFNNHKNIGSTRNRLARLFGRCGYKGMSISEVKTLLAESDLEIVKTYHLCVFPASDEHLLLPIFLLRPIEALLSKYRPLRNFGENHIYVCRNTHAKKE